MVFQANVVEDGKSYTSVPQSEAMIKEATEVILSAVEPLREKEITGFASSNLPDGTTLWQVPTGGFTDTSVGALELMEYFPGTAVFCTGTWVTSEL